MNFEFAMKLHGYTSTLVAYVVLVLIIFLSLDYSVKKNDVGKAIKTPSPMKDCLVTPSENLTKIQHTEYSKTFNFHSQLDTTSAGSAEDLDEETKTMRISNGLMENVGERFRKRKEFLTKACSRLQERTGNVAQTLSYRLYYSPKYHLMICVIAKVGSTTWKNNLYQILGMNRGTHVHGNNRRIRANSYFSARRLLSFMTHEGLGTKVLTVRHPLERLVSAYRDKFLDGAPTGKPWKNIFIARLLRQLGKTVDQNESVSVSFQEFLQFVVKDHQGGHTINPHWRGFSKTCSPCFFSYDYILTTDTWEEDMAFLVNSLNITEVTSANRLNSYKEDGRGTPSFFPYYEGIPPHLLQSIYSIYRADFEIFNYSLPQFMRDAQEKS